ncbi:S1 RNA-binding domain-containing protein [Pelotomaculum terephthalicicum JT]|uniref:S1 RNA-binding domain-containing protein n=1 Tax=Pelotomaculum TaxID=191373 RepID=UPI0009C56D27|nr:MULTISPECIES: S1 RNA-binding domain-containing protein [Pelotomaculum]MCG9968302.1 S1 RNA-binding domain-containing protein [Pelotomaculum terephthalicicum JT]OPX89494.1 MAG: General stress protein 13 [Pelotomaculum sp. PtaB.Bin117]OPY63251.1 MAG: General stress protein 13 [Pelotomaculum sp. PtaU1.Bin065]
MPIELGSVVEGTVTGITNFGAFIELPGGETGLVHISEIAEVYVKDVNDFLKTSDKVKVKVISVDPKGKVGLSIKKANPAPNRVPKKKIQASFEDKLAKFLKESEERQQVLKRGNESKRGGRGSCR